jgi:hypothetical protein
MKRANYYVTTLQQKRLLTLSKKSGLSVSEIVRRAIDEYWDKYQPVKKGGPKNGNDL